MFDRTGCDSNEITDSRLGVDAESGTCSASFSLMIISRAFES